MSIVFEIVKTVYQCGETEEEVVGKFDNALEAESFMKGLIKDNVCQRTTYWCRSKTTEKVFLVVKHVESCGKHEEEELQGYYNPEDARNLANKLNKERNQVYFYVKEQEREVKS